MQVEFEKWHGLGNDFIVIWRTPSNKELESTLIQNAHHLCNRDNGHVGADGILLCTANKNEVFPQSVKIINSDGSIAKNCGNGLRCVMGSIWRRSTGLNDSIDQDTVAELNVEDETFFGRYVQNIPKEFLSPTLNKISITMPPPESADWKQNLAEFSGKISSKLKILSCFSIGNPHAIAEWTGDHGELYSVASKLQEFECNGSTGVNLHVISERETKGKQFVGKLASHGHKDVWVWERGAGPTKACGSGACAVAAHTYAELEADYGEWIEIKMPGGLLWVRQKEKDEPIELMGPTEMTFSGELHL